MRDDNSATHSNDIFKNKIYKIGLLGEITSKMSIYFSKILIWAIYSFLNGISAFRRWSRGVSLKKMSSSSPLARFGRLCERSSYYKYSHSTSVHLKSFKSSKIFQNDHLFFRMFRRYRVLCVVFVFIAFFGFCQFNQRRILEQVKAGLKNIRYLFNVVLFEMYNIPGGQCMMEDNCCSTAIMSFKRWVYCFFTLTYRVSISEIRVKKRDWKNINKALQNFTDGSLRPSIYRTVILSKDIRREISLARGKAYKLSHLISNIGRSSQLNLSRIDALNGDNERLIAITQNQSKKHDILKKNTEELIELIKHTETSATESKNFVRRISLKFKEDLEIYFNDKIWVTNQFENTIKVMEKKINNFVATNPFNKELEILKNDVKKIQRSELKSQARIIHIESLKQQFETDVKSLLEYTHNRCNNELAHYDMTDGDLAERAQKQVLILQNKLDSFVADQRSKVTHHVSTYYKLYNKRIYTKIMKLFCPKIQEILKSTIPSAMSLSHIKASGIFQSSFKKFDNLNIPFDCCLKERVVVKRVKEALEMFSADTIGLMDYALDRNGGQVLEEFTSPSFEFEQLDDSKEICQSNLPFLNQLMSSPKKIINSVKVLNTMNNVPRRCWQFKGNTGSTIIKLASIVNVTMVTIDHIHPEISLSKSYADSPKDLDIFALPNLFDLNGTLIGSYTFEDVTNYPIQSFLIESPKPSQFIKVVVKSNHGADVTCVYRIRIHGADVK